MKKILSWGLMLAAAFTLTNCAKEITNPDQQPETAGYPFEISASVVDTKTVNDGIKTKWVAGDQINLFHAVCDMTEYKNDGAFTISNADASKFGGSICEALDPTEEYDWYAFYPYTSTLETPKNTTVAINIGTDLVQDGYGSMAHLAGEALPLYGKAIAVPGADMPSIKMNQLASVIAVNVTNNTAAPIEVNEVEFFADGNYLTGTYYVDFSGASVEYKPAQAQVTATVTVNNATSLAVGATATVYIPIIPFSAWGGDSLTLTVNGEVTKELVIENDVHFTAGKIKNLNFSYVVEEEPEPELPSGLSTLYTAITSTAQSTLNSFEINVTDAIVTYVNGSNAYVEDATAGILIYKSSHGLKAGDKLNGTLSGKGWVRYGVAQITEFSLTGITKESGAEIPVTVVSVADLLNDYKSYVSKRIQIVDATVTDGMVGLTDRNGVVKQGDKTVNLYNNNASVNFAGTSVVDFYAYPSYYNTTKQLATWETPTTKKVATPEIVCASNVVTVTCGTSGATIYCSVDGGEYAQYSAPIEITKTVVVKAYATKDGAANSEEATVECEWVDPSTLPTTATATLSFANKAQRTTFTTSKQVWEQNGIVLTNDKGSSTSNVADYANPARFYKSSKITITMTGKTMTEIKFVCNSSSYASALKSSLPSGNTVAVSGSNVTVTLATPAESFVINSLTGGQVRMNSLTVTYNN